MRTAPRVLHPPPPTPQRPSQHPSKHPSKHPFLMRTPSLWFCIRTGRLLRKVWCVEPQSNTRAAPSEARNCRAACRREQEGCSTTTSQEGLRPKVQWSRPQRGTLPAITPPFSTCRSQVSAPRQRARSAFQVGARGRRARGRTGRRSTPGSGGAEARAALGESVRARIALFVGTYFCLVQVDTGTRPLPIEEEAAANEKRTEVRKTWHDDLRIRTTNTDK